MSITLKYYGTATIFKTIKSLKSYKVKMIIHLQITDCCDKLIFQEYTIMF